MLSHSAKIEEASVALTTMCSLNSNHLAEAALAVWVGPSAVPPQAATTMIATASLTPEALALVRRGIAW